MRPLTRSLIRSAVPARDYYEEWTEDRPLQAYLHKDPWKVAVASMLLCRTRRAQAQPVLRTLLGIWPECAYLARSDTTMLEAVVRPCGLHRSRARQLQRFSWMFLEDSWEDLRELPGVGLYVADSVGLFCFEDTDLESKDHVLAWWAEATRDAIDSYPGALP